MRLALVDVGLAARAGEPLRAVAGERARSIHADAVVLARGPLLALVDVFAAVDALVAAGARTSIGTIDGACVTDGVGVTWVRRARVVQVAQQTRLARCAFAVEATHSVDAGSTVEASGASTVVDIRAARRSGPTIYADARKSADGVGTSCTILTYARSL